MNYLDRKNIHFVGIGGTGMSGLAKIMLARGCAVTGSDTNPSYVLKSLVDQGAKISIGQKGQHISEETDLVVLSAAIKSDNKEWIKAHELGIPMIKYAQMLGLLVNDKKGVAISGTHGKTTTTSLMAFVLRQIGLDPTFVIGGESPELGGSSGVGKGDYFVVESCEFDRSFLNMKPWIAVVNNIEEDHLDYYQDLAEIQSAFQEFANQIHAEGALVYCADCRTTRQVAANATVKTISFGFDRQAEYRIEGVALSPDATSFKLSHKGADLGEFRLSLSGSHNVLNATAVIAVAMELGADLDAVREALPGFKGVTRRFEVKAEIKGVTIIDDYAHHPTEVQQVLQTVMYKYPNRRIWSVFQPHQYSRTRFLLKDFADALRSSDFVIMPEIVFVRDTERDRQLVSAKDLAREIRHLGGNAVFIPTLEDIANYLVNNLDPGDIVLTLGAADVWKLADELVRRLRGVC